MSRPSIIRGGELARRLGVSPATLCALVARNSKLRCCIIDESDSRRHWWSVSKLIAAGFLYDDAPSVRALPQLPPIDHLVTEVAHVR